MAEYRIAVATSDGKTVDTHFGHARSFVIFAVDEDNGAFRDVGERVIDTALCAGGECGAPCGGRNGASGGQDVMDAIAGQLEGVSYVLVARIGPHAIRALARRGITAYDIVLPVEEAVAKINEFRKRNLARRQTNRPVS